MFVELGRDIQFLLNRAGACDFQIVTGIQIHLHMTDKDDENPPGKVQNGGFKQRIASQLPHFRASFFFGW
jgi:hypothetical protein